MSLTVAEVKKIAHLARLTFSEEELTHYTKQLSNIVDFVHQMDTVNTDTIQPIAHALDLTQPLREDKVTEQNQRNLFQSIAPCVEAGLYLVPKVIDNES